MHYYKAYNRTIRSNHAIPELLVTIVNPEMPIDIEIDVQLNRHARLHNHELIYKNDSTAAINQIRYLIYSSPDSYIIVYINLAAYKISNTTDQTQKITIYCQDEFDSKIRGTLLNSIFSVTLELSGNLCLHGSCLVSKNQLTIGFLGPSGAGKSTMAAYFQADGARLLSDDILALEFKKDGVYVSPAYPAIRLSNESIEHLQKENKLNSGIKPNKTNHKNYITPSRFGSDETNNAPIKLDFLCLLDRHSSCTSLSEVNNMGQKLVELSRNSLSPLLSIKFELMRERIKLLAKVASAVPIYHLAYQNDYKYLYKVNNLLHSCHDTKPFKY